MQSFFIALSNFISQVVDFIFGLFEKFFSLLSTLSDAVTFVVNSVSLLPDLFAVPMMIILSIMFIKFCLSLGKQ